ncbi:conserved Plasmodium protein, unknown function [Plasmodium ovale]|uniref:Uncharacterized protein n=1 Tax=Plasmodium ovale TaxID=36330 RepID=A0A1C3L521_PLAOA|nr:conserved Plasmodium protein, unknown function [Plasmodium ovale]
MYRIRRVYFSNDVNLGNLLRKKAILFENVKREYCKKEIIVNYFYMKGLKLEKNDIHIMTNILCRPTGRIMVLIEDKKKKNFSFDFDVSHKGMIETHEKESKIKNYFMDENNIEYNEIDDDKSPVSNDDKSPVSNDDKSPVSNDDKSPVSNDDTVAISEKREKDISPFMKKKRFIQMNIYDDTPKNEEIGGNSTANINLKRIFTDCKIHLCDNYEIEKFVEECERFIRFTEDIKRISKFENLDKIITIINIPSCYGRKELAKTILDCSNIRIDLKNIIFRFKKNGIQSDCAYVLCNTISEANILINKMQEYPIAKKYHLKEFYGTSFLYASKNNLFLSCEKLDYLTIFSKYKIFTCGWHKDISTREFESFLITLKIFPKKIVKINYTWGNTTVDKVAGKAVGKAVGNAVGNAVGKAVENAMEKVEGIAAGKAVENAMENAVENAAEADKAASFDGDQLAQSAVEPNHVTINIDEVCAAADDHGSISANGLSEFNTSSFILFFENMRMTKKVFTKLERLKKKWKMAAASNFYAYPKVPDIHFDDDDEYKDENEYEDSDLDEEIEY